MDELLSRWPPSDVGDLLLLSLILHQTVHHAGKGVHLIGHYIYGSFIDTVLLAKVTKQLLRMVHICDGGIIIFCWRGQTQVGYSWHRVPSGSDTITQTILMGFHGDGQTTPSRAGDRN